jgi:hypothetical protein
MSERIETDIITIGKMNFIKIKNKKKKFSLLVLINTFPFEKIN